MKNCLKELIRIISQWAETTYWYRFRKNKSYGRNVSLLNDSWGGSSTLINWQILKVEHSYHNIRKHSSRTLCYIDSSTFLEKCNEDDKKLIIEYLQEEAIDDKEFHWCGGKFYYTFEKDKWMILKSERENAFREVFASWDEMIAWADKNIVNEECSFIDTVIKSAISIDIKPSDLYKLSDEVKNNLRGKRIVLHNLATYRRLLKKLDKLDFPYSEPWASKLDEIHNIFNCSHLRRKALDNLWEEFKSHRMSILTEIAQFWNEKCDLMWD